MSEYLSRLLFPRDTVSFLQHYQAREHFHIARNTPGYYADLLTAADIDAVLQSTQLSAAPLNVVTEGVVSPIGQWSRIETTQSGRTAHRVVVPEKVLGLYAAGATLILNQAHCAIPSLIETCRVLTEAFGFPTQANIYITPRASTGFVKHADDHDVLILQIAGSKDWIVYPSNAPPVEIDLQSGDLLYIPRGMFHAAKSRCEDSIHITLGLRPVLAFQLLDELEALAGALDHFQQPMPPRFAGPDAIQEFESNFLTGLQTLLAGLKPSALTNRRHDELVTNQQQGWSGRFSDLRILHLITIDTVVCKRPGIVTAVEDDGKLLRVAFSDTQVVIPAFMRHEIPRILGDSSFAVNQIDGMITSAGKVKFITEFVKAGLLRIVSI